MEYSEIDLVELKEKLEKIIKWGWFCMRVNLFQSDVKLAVEGGGNAFEKVK